MYPEYTDFLYDTFKKLLYRYDYHWVSRKCLFLVYSLYWRVLIWNSTFTSVFPLKAIIIKNTLHLAKPSAQFFEVDVIHIESSNSFIKLPHLLNVLQIGFTNTFSCYCVIFYIELFSPENSFWSVLVIKYLK